MRLGVRPRRSALAVVFLGGVLVLSGCSGGDPGTEPAPTGTGADLPTLPTPTPTAEGDPPLTFSATPDGCVTPDRDDWRALVQATGLGDLDGDGEDDFVLQYTDRRSPIRGVVESSADGTLAPIHDQAGGRQPGGTPRPGPVLEIAGRTVLALDLGGTPNVRLGFARLDGCSVDLLPVGGDPGGFPYATAATDCLPECGVGLQCTGSGVETVAWEVFVRGPDGQPVPWEDVADDPEVRSDDLRVRVTTTRFSLGSSGFSAGRPGSYTTVVDDGRLAALHDGFICGELQLHPFSQELTGFGIDPVVFDRERDALR